MRLCVIGLGQAGGKILDKFLEEDAASGSNIISGAVAVNTAEADLSGLEYVPTENRVLIGQTHVKGHGVGADNELGATIAEEDIEEVQQALDSVPVHEIDAFLLIGGLGGGTGSGTMPVVAKHLKDLHREPVYGLGVLPGRNEGGIYSLNAARSFQTCVREVDNLILWDNDAWAQSNESLGGSFESMNHELVRRLRVLFGAGELDAQDDVAESVVDASEIINTLKSGGISTIGYATEELSDEELGNTGLLSRFRNSTPEVDSATSVNRITSLLRKATLGSLTVPAEVESTERALVIVAGPQHVISRKGIEKGRNWIEEQTNSMEVRGGDYPVDGKHVAGLVLMSGVTDIPRIKELQRVAIEASERIDELRDESDAKLDELVDPDDGDDLDPLF